MNNTNDIINSFKKIIAFFDIFDYPLTANEIWQYSGKNISIAETISILGNPEAALGQKNGFYFLPGREEIIAIRMSRYNYALRKLKAARRFIKLFKYLPFIKVIALANSIGSHNLRDSSDIDLFIITSPRRIWLTRFILASVAKLLRRRPTPKNKRDKICLSFYVTTESLNMDNLKLAGDDPYFFYWLRTLFPLHNKNKTYEKFLALNRVNFLLDEELPDKEKEEKKNRLLDFLEILIKKIQIKIMSPALKAAMNKSSGVIINDKVLKLYLRDNRADYAEKYGNKLKQIFAEVD